MDHTHDGVGRDLGDPGPELPAAGAAQLVAAVQDLAAVRDLDSLMAIVRHVARQLTGADGATFILRDGDRCYYADEEAIAPLWKGSRFPMSACVSGWVMLNRQAALIEDIGADARVPQEAYRATFVKSMVVVPVRRAAPIAAIGNYWATRHQPTAAEVALLQALADSTSVALENVRLYGELTARVTEVERAAERQGLLARTGSLLGDSFDIAANFARVGRLLVPDFADLFAVQLAAEDGPPTLAAAIHADPALEPQAQALLAGWPAAERARRSGEVLQGSAAAPGSDGSLATLGMNSYFVAPMIARGAVLGTVTLARAAARPAFDSGDVEFATELARRCAPAVESSRLFAQAQSAIRARDEFLTAAAHELRTPLTALNLQLATMGDLLGCEGDKRDCRAARGAERALRSTERLTRLVESLLDVFTVGFGDVSLHPEPFDLRMTVADVLDRFRGEAQRAGCALSVEGAERAVGSWDRARIEQVIAHLLSNAIKYGPGKPIVVGLAVDPAAVRLSVRDHGIGVARADVPRLFERFGRIASTRHYGGLALGLYVSRRIVEAHGGSIRVDSEVGVGSTFTVELPRHRVPSGATS